VIPPRDFGVVKGKKNHSKLYAVEATVIKQHNIAVT